MKNFGKFIKKFIVLFFVLLYTLTTPFLNIFADEFYENKINVKINKDGSADIESIMDFKATNGTEYYIPISNLSKSEIQNFRVSEIVGGKEIPYESMSSWNVNASREQKAKKSGIVKTQKGYELCFGFGEYERKTFVLKYKVTNFVKILNDLDMIFWKFVNNNLSASPEQVTVSISKENGKFDNTNSKIWAFGNKGKIEFIDGKIEFKSLERLGSSNYVTILTRLNKGDILSGEKINKDFSYYQDMAFKGSDYTDKGTKNIFDKVREVPEIAISILTFFIIISAIVWFSTRDYGEIIIEKINGGYKKGELKSEYYRSLPTKEWENLVLVLRSTKFDAKKAILRAYFLKWIQDRLLIPIKEKSGFVFKKEVMSLKINDYSKYCFKNDAEKSLFKILEIAAKNDRVLQQNELKKYFKKSKNRTAFKKIIYDFSTNSENFLIQNDFLKKRKNGKVSKEYNEKGRELTKNLVCYYNYLKDFTLLSEREISEIKVWKELLIYATLFGVAEKVQKQLKKLAPEVLEEYDVDVDLLHTAMIYSSTFSNTFVDSYSSAVAGSSGGDGGFSSIGGGGGSFGGDSGGGTR